MLELIREKCFTIKSFEEKDILYYKTFNNYSYGYQGEKNKVEDLFPKLMNSFSKQILPDFFMRYIL